jgi:SAM-dependent methyltransferase
MRDWQEASVSSVDPRYELDRTPQEPVLRRKIKTKRILYRVVGEVYIGRRVKLAYFRRWLSRLDIRPGWRILDVGSGDGVFAFYTAHRYPKAEVVGLELNGTEVRVCQAIAADEQLRNLSFAEGVPEGYIRDDLDLIYCLDVLEHIKDDAAAVEEMARKLRPGGHLLIHVPNRFFKHSDGRVETVADEDAWKINPGHVRHGYTPMELGTLLHAANLRVDLIEQTQGTPVALAHRLYAFVERWLPLRVLILPLVDLLTWRDRRRSDSHGNTVWALATKPL